MDPLDNLRWKLLSVLHLFIGLTAIVGGGALVVWPTGRMLGMTVAQLAPSPFTDFLLPGILLYGAVGVHHAIAAYLVARREPGAELASFSSGLALLIWIGVEMAMVKDSHWLQYGFGGLAAIVLIQAIILRFHRHDRPNLPLGAQGAH